MHARRAARYIVMVPYLLSLPRPGSISVSARRVNRGGYHFAVGPLPSSPSFPSFFRRGANESPREHSDKVNQRPDSRFMANQTSVDDDERNARAHERLTDAMTAASEEYLLAACRRISMARMTQSATSCDLDYAVFFSSFGLLFYLYLDGFIYRSTWLSSSILGFLEFGRFCDGSLLRYLPMTIRRINVYLIK